MRSDHLLRHMKVHKEEEKSVEHDNVVNEDSTVLDKFSGIFLRNNNFVETSKEYNIFKDDEDHWSCYYKDGNQRIYFNSFGCSAPKEVLCYLKTDDELKHNIPVIQRNNDVFQHDNSLNLCKQVIKALTNGQTFCEIINELKDKEIYN